MTDVAVPYPPSPPNVPADLTTPTGSYRARVVIVLISLLLFALLYLGLVVGSAYLCYWCFASTGSATRSTAAGRSILQDAARTEQRILTEYNEALRQRKLAAIDNARLLRIIEGDLLPPWRAQRELLAGVRGLPDEEQRLIELCRRSFQLQEEAWELLARAIRENNRTAGDQSRMKSNEADQLARQVAADAELHFRRQNPQSNDHGFWKVIAGIISGLLCLFLVKGFFKWRRHDQGLRLEVTETEQPVLFAFIRQICRDTHAPLPHRVFLTSEVNAAVFYKESILSLFLPTPKNLIVGLGLVNQLNLSEFKAVLAHEFGHFSQTTMKLGGYVYTSNRVISDIVYGRDWLDNIVAILRGIDFRIAIFAWGFTGILWVLRMSLQGLFRVINFAHSALSRQMEFNADLVAASVTGSDALVHGLSRLDFATDSLMQAWIDLTAAADHNLYSRDFFYHQTRAAEFLRTIRQKPNLGEPPALPDDPHEVQRVFSPSDTSVPRMWATHPSNHDREVNLKKHYIRSPIDDRSPWILFQDVASVREKVTRHLYEVARKAKDLDLKAPEVVQAFIDEEHAETTYHPRYQGLYDHRYLTPGTLDELLLSAPADLANRDELAAAHARLYENDLKARMDDHRARQEDFRRVAPLAHGAVELTGKDFQFRGDRYRVRDAKKLFDQVKQELDRDYEWMKDIDRLAFHVYHCMARQVADAARRELEDRYRFHLAVQDIHFQLSAHQQQVQMTLGRMAGRSEVSQAEFQAALDVFGQAHDALSNLLDTADRLHLPPLKNFTAGEMLGPFLLSQSLLQPICVDQNRLDGDWIGRFLEQVGEVLDKTNRMQNKSMGGILALQEKLAQQWSAHSGFPTTVDGIKALP